MASFNRVIIAGNLTRDIELRYIQSGTAVADVSVAVNERRKKGDEYVDDVHFIDCTLWGRTAEVASEYLAKGSPVLFEGRLTQERWEKDGEKRSKIKITVEKLQMLGKGNGGGGSSSRSSSDDMSEPVGEPAAESGYDESTIPF